MKARYWIFLALLKPVAFFAVRDMGEERIEGFSKGFDFTKGGLLPAETDFGRTSRGTSPDSSNFFKSSSGSKGSGSADFPDSQSD